MANRAQHRWKVSTFVLLVALVAAVGGRRIAAADAQMKSVPKPVPILSQGGDGKKKLPPAALATKLLEAAKTLVARSGPDPTGRRARALQFIDLAASEAKAMSANDEPAEGAPTPAP